MVLLRALLYGGIASLLTAMISLLWVGFGKAQNITFIAGIVIWLLASLFTGGLRGFNSGGPQARVEYVPESMEDRTSRWRHSQIVFLFGLPFIIIGAVMYFYT